MAISETNRRSVNFPPSIWSDDFPSFTSNSMKTKFVEEHQKLKLEVTNMLKDAVDSPQKSLDLIDALQRLGVSYHFEEMIDAILHAVYLRCNALEEDNTLYKCSLRFRLLRQHGYRISSDMLGKFKDEQGKGFKESLKSDVEGMLSLYEATHLMFHGEDILEEALVFTTDHFQSMAMNLTPPLSTQITYALSLPLRKNSPRLVARHYISVYEQNPSHNTLLLTFAKLDYNMLQELHQKELQDLIRWWKIVDVSSKLSYARSRVPECYFWALTVYFEPQFSLGRMNLTKVIVLLSLLDDTYDVYGTIQELELFTEAIDRWDMGTINDLPDYMKVLYKLILDVFKEIEETMIAEGKLYALHYAKEEMKGIAAAYMKETECFKSMIMPTMEEYLELGERTSAGVQILAAAFLGFDKNIMTKECLDWAFGYPQMMKACSLILRVINDIKSHEFEQNRGFVATSVECYMKQHGVTKEKAKEDLKIQIDNAWKDINELCLQPFHAPLSVIDKVLNLLRTSMVVYKDGDGYTFAHVLIKDIMASLLVDPVPLPDIGQYCRLRVHSFITIYHDE